MKKWLITLFAVFAVLLVLPQQAQASQYCGGNVTWECDNGTLTVSGTGSMEDYGEEDVRPWENEYIACVVVEDGVTGIGARAFAGFSDLWDIQIADSVVSIGADAFADTAWLSNQWQETIYAGKVLYKHNGSDDPYIEEDTVGIAAGAFRDNTEFYNITLPENVVYIGEGAFTGTPWLENQPDGLVYAGKVLYLDKGGCSDYVTDILEDTVAIAGGAFRDSTNLCEVTVPDSVVYIGSNAFAGCTSLNSVTLSYSETLRSIGNSAFAGCTSLTYMDIPYGMTEIGNAAFRNSALGWIEIWDGCQIIGNRAFEDCQYLEDVTAYSGLTHIGDRAFYGCYNLSEITFPDTVERIGEYAFSGCTGLKTLTFEGAVPTLGYGAFEYLTAVALYPQGTTPNTAQEHGGNLAWLENDGTLTVRTVGSCGNPGWALFTNGELLIFGTGDMSDYNYDTGTYVPCPWESNAGDITSVQVMDGVTGIGSYAFSKCTKLSDISIADSVVRIGRLAFANTPWYTAQAEGMVYAGKVAYAYKGTVPATVTFEAGTLGLGGALFRDCAQLTAVTLPDSLVSIGASAFESCTGLTAVSFPKGLTYIGLSAFQGCTGIEEIVLPDSVTQLGYHVFYGCTGLRRAVIGNGLSTVSFNAFNGCTALTELTVGTKVSLLDRSAFYGCTSLASVNLPDSVKTIGDSAFFGCTALTEINGGNGVTAINEYAFYSCTGLTHMQINAKVKSIKYDAFYNCVKLTAFTVDESNPYFCADSQGVLYNKAQTRLEQLPTGWQGAYSVPEGVTEIADYAAYQRKSLTGLVLPDSMETVGNYAFGHCAALKSMDLGGTSYISQGAFWGCSALPGIVIPDSVTTVTESAFRECTGLAYAVLGSGIKNVNYSVFADCTGLRFVGLPAGIVRMSYSAFNDCDALEHVAYGGTQAQWDAISWRSATTSDKTSCLTAADTFHYEASLTVTDGKVSCSICGAINPAFGVYVNGSMTGSFTELADALDGYENGYIKLLEDAQVDITLTKDLYIDLNGHMLSGVMRVNGYQLYGMDSTTNSYTCDAIGYFFCVDGEGNTVVPVTHFKSDITGRILRYLAIGDEKGWSFHRFYLGITHASVKPGVDGVGFKAVFAGDEMVCALIDSYGYQIGLGAFDPVTVRRTEMPVSGKTFSVRIENFDVESYGETSIYAAAYITVNGDTITASQYTTTLRNILETVNANYTRYTLTQLEELKKLIERHSVMQTWEIKNLI